MRPVFKLALPFAVTVLAAGCSDTLGPAAARILPVAPGAVLPRSTVTEPARIPIAIQVECGDHAALAFDVRASEGEIRVTVRGRREDFSGGCVDDLDSVVLRVPPTAAQRASVTRFSQGG